MTFIWKYPEAQSSGEEEPDLLKINTYLEVRVNYKHYNLVHLCICEIVFLYIFIVYFYLWICFCVCEEEEELVQFAARFIGYILKIKTFLEVHVQLY